jgi:hypothetical protein
MSIRGKAFRYSFSARRAGKLQWSCKKRRSLGARVSVVFVSAYLALVGSWLLATRQIQAPGLRKIVFNKFRRRYSGELNDFRPDSGACWVAAVPDYLLSDKESASALVLLEDTRPLGPAHSSHEEIRRIGGGRFCHWGAEVYFSTSDSSDPRTNGRRYSVQEATL